MPSTRFIRQIHHHDVGPVLGHRGGHLVADRNTATITKPSAAAGSGAARTDQFLIIDQDDGDIGGVAGGGRVGRLHQGMRLDPEKPLDPLPVNGIDARTCQLPCAGPTSMLPEQLHPLPHTAIRVPRISAAPPSRAAGW